ncbi:xanthine dehydrogenase family protein molybdopterin-binding subunit [Rhodobacter ferrooxidans]|uniref:Aldehyde oxidase and xanthine dehydrogenase molybdopterin binding n=1 Tax=Rhodobacter ferrooxidans TaxID=371731 RepID=C8RX02_9RHOB|nr:molybdopterin cofactor-binding domain-containing protein [Rhodobacter sp. SW2]EEW26527.1 aldehyde oxidase and xanthine dehydrogenase molybdopterin binding [Rhodobacter sp. SW2]
MSRLATIARRSFLIGSVAILGGVAFGTYAYRKPWPNPLLGGEDAALTPYVLIDATGVTIIAPRAEMGQGVHTTLAALVAEEMDLPWDQVRVIHGPASKAYFNAAVLEEGVPFAPTDTGWMAESLRKAMQVPGKLLGLQITGGSSSTPDAYEKMRAAGAVARVALIGAAARRLGLDAAVLKTEGGAVVAPDGTRLSYIELATEAASVPLPDTPPLKPRAEWKLLGTSLPRPDMPGKITGAAQFTADLRLSGMLFGTVRCNPGLGAPMKSYDATAALAMPGVVQVVEVENGVAVLARSTWEAFSAANAITFDWAPAAYPADTAAMLAAVDAAFDADRLDSRSRDDGDVEAALTVGDIFEAQYSVPYLAHATMEPMCAAALLTDGHLQVWTGTQLPTQILKEGAALTGLPVEAIEVHTMLMGGGFGRRAEMDVARQAITVAKAVEGTPVLLTWSREEDTTHDVYRPMAKARLRARVEAGKVAAFDLHLAAPSVIASQVGRLGYSVPGPDSSIVQGAWEQPYDFTNHRVTGYRVPAGVPVGSWRAVGASQNGFFHESAVDELAHLAGVDPLEFRLAHISHEPSRKVLEAVGRMSHWGAAPIEGRARGLAFSLSFGVPVAEVIEIEQTTVGIRLIAAFAAVDVGTALDPGIIEAQVQGGMVFGLSAAIMGEISFAQGRAQQSNFTDYDALRLPQCPPISVTILENGDRIRGIGEPGLPPAAPALANAIFALTGQRIRDLPLNKSIAFA